MVVHAAHIILVHSIGSGVVSNSFADQYFDVIASIDSDETSNASIKDDIRNVDPSSLSGVADALWASPGCATYSRLAANIHRNVSKGEYAISDNAIEQDDVFCQMINFMTFTKAKHPHCVFIIENPATGCLGEMPCKCRMCPTNIWHAPCFYRYSTNDYSIALLYHHVISNKVMVSRLEKCIFIRTKCETLIFSLLFFHRK